MEEKKNATVTKQETLQALRKPGELYAVMSGVTRMPFVVCDEETFDDEVLLYYRVEDAQEKAKQLAEQNYRTAVAKIEEQHILAFYTNLFTMGVNCLAVNAGTDMAIQIQLTDLVTRGDPGGKEDNREPGAASDCALFHAGASQDDKSGTDGRSERASGRTAGPL